MKIYCQKEEIALFGKLFRLVNDRIRRQEYDENIYKHLNADFEKETLEEIIIQNLSENLIEDEKVEQFQ